MIRTEEEHLAHYGILRRSGRYPWGSGDTQSKRNKSFLDITNELRKQGMSNVEIAKGFNLTTTELIQTRSIAVAQQRQEKQQTARRLKEKGWSNGEIGKRMGGLNESSVRALLVASEKDNQDVLGSISNMLKDQLETKKYIDVGKGVEYHLGITDSRLKTAVAMLKEEGYVTHNIKTKQVFGAGHFTTQKVLAKPGTTLQEVQRNRGEIRQITETSEDHGRNFFSIQTPINVNSKRISVNYAEDGGSKADGVIYVRRGVPELSIGGNNYSQVRIAVDGTHYMKGMAVYRDDLPPGVDLVFNTNKHKNIPLTNKDPDGDSVLKPMNLKDPDLPFGAIVNQIHGPDGKVISAMNKVGSKEGSGEEGSWDKWSRNLPSQVLSKQSPVLAQQQLKVTYDRRLKELAEINALTNPTVRKKLLVAFGEETDSAAVHLKAASLPRQATKVLLPVPSMKETEVYAPSMRDGERVALVRFPHGGTFEIPQLTVNNRNREARRLLGSSAQDAIGINHKVAERLSGADFDGDTVLVIPNNKRQIKSTPALEDLKGFDPHVYALSADSPIKKISPKRKQTEMGKISNLITDMTLQGASSDELARAVKHSMVVIDSEKHHLDFVQSEKDHGIKSLKEEYQGGKTKGARTLISRAKAPTRVPETFPRYTIDPVTGKKVYKPTGRMEPDRRLKVDPATGKKHYVDTGKLKPVTQESRKLAETDDAHTLVSDMNTRMEIIYADHSNVLKGLANAARKDSVNTKSIPYSPSAKAVYSHEVATLNGKLNTAKKNAPLERQAQLLAQVKVGQVRQANPHMEDAELKKVKQAALNESRIRTGAKKEQIKITPTEWQAIQAGAISNSKLEEILNNADLDVVRALALPKSRLTMSPSKMVRAQAMLASGYTQIEVADALGVGLTTLKVSLNE